METTRKTDKNGVTVSTNWMLDDVIDVFKEAGIDNDELIKKLTIQKIEYGRYCIAEFLAQGGQTRQTFNYKYNTMDNVIKSVIVKIGGEPIIYNNNK